jgi:ABC-2 type transport system ATP-binding protein
VNDATALDQATLAVTEVRKSYGKVQALNGVTLRVDKGEFAALLGPNGAGKTTLFQLLTGLFVAEEGAIVVHGHDIRHHPVRALAAIGVVFQQPTLDLDLSVRANLQFHARLHGIPRELAAQRIHRELERVQLTDRANDPARSLSGGNRRKVELARALLHEPALLLMDEPSVGLDPASRESLLSYVLELCGQRGLAVLWATHLVDEAERAHRVMVLHRGNMLVEGPPDSLTAQTGQPTLARAFLHLTGEGKDREGAN